MFPEDTIYFYAQTVDYAEFSNFASYGVALDGPCWPTVEHYFQAQKLDAPDYRDRIRLARRPKDAKALGMTRQPPMRSDWETVKDGVMNDAVCIKFQTNRNARCCLSPQAKA